MRKVTIKRKIFRFNLIMILSLVLLVTVTFNIIISLYLERQILDQLTTVATENHKTLIASETVSRPNMKNMPPQGQNQGQTTSTVPETAVMPAGTRMPIQMLNTELIYLDDQLRIIPQPADDGSKDIIEVTDLELSIAGTIIGKWQARDNTGDTIEFSIDDSTYAGIVFEVPDNELSNLTYIIIYSSLDEIRQLQRLVNLTLLGIFLVFSLVAIVFSSYVSRAISTPITTLCTHMETLAERDFDKRIDMEVDGELHSLVEHINIMSEKLEQYDDAQKRFLQNASHEFRTPLMSIQSHAEGIKYEVIEPTVASDIILSETQRMTRLVEDLMYLNRLEAVEENDGLVMVDLREIIEDCCGRMNLVAQKQGLMITAHIPSGPLFLKGDEELLSRAIINLLSNGIRYASNSIGIAVRQLQDGAMEITVSDDGPGFDEQEIEHLFERFYKGKKGNHGLGLAIVKSIVLKHGGTIVAENTGRGATFRIRL